MGLVREVGAAAFISVRGIRQRAAMSISTVVGIALCVGVLLSFLAMANGFQKMLDSTGSPAVAVILNKDSDREMGSSISASEYRLLDTLPYIARQNGRAVLSPEVTRSVGGQRRRGDYAGITMRGMSSLGPTLRTGVRLVEGRQFSPGTNEIVVGDKVAQDFEGFKVGSEVRLGGADWRVVGTFESPGALWASEIWADATIVQSLDQSGSSVQSVRALLASPSDLPRLKSAIETDPRFKMSVRSEKAFFQNQSKGTAALIARLGWPLALALALGAVAGALNTMYSSVSTRGAEIATLRAFGFGRLSTFISTLAEALVLSAAGAALGSLVGALILNNISGSTLGANMTQVAFDLSVSWRMIVQAWILALGVGLVGGAIPAWHAARRPIVAGLASVG
jgi:putative ABC transport system permease protein